MINTHEILPSGEYDSVAVGMCKGTNEEYTTSSFNSAGYYKWRSRSATIQECLPNLNNEDREFLISGISPEGWKELFG